MSRLGESPTVSACVARAEMLGFHWAPLMVKTGPSMYHVISTRTGGPAVRIFTKVRGRHDYLLVPAFPNFRVAGGIESTEELVKQLKTIEHGLADSRTALQKIRRDSISSILDEHHERWQTALDNVTTKSKPKQLDATWVGDWFHSRVSEIGFHLFSERHLWGLLTEFKALYSCPANHIKMNIVRQSRSVIITGTSNNIRAYPQGLFVSIDSKYWYHAGTPPPTPVEELARIDAIIDSVRDSSTLPPDRIGRVFHVCSRLEECLKAIDALKLELEKRCKNPAGEDQEVCVPGPSDHYRPDRSASCAVVDEENDRLKVINRTLEEDAKSKAFPIFEVRRPNFVKRLFCPTVEVSVMGCKVYGVGLNWTRYDTDDNSEDTFITNRTSERFWTRHRSLRLTQKGFMKLYKSKNDQWRNHMARSVGMTLKAADESFFLPLDNSQPDMEFLMEEDQIIPQKFSIVRKVAVEVPSLLSEDFSSFHIPSETEKPAPPKPIVNLPIPPPLPSGTSLASSKAGSTLSPMLNKGPEGKSARAVFRSENFGDWQMKVSGPIWNLMITDLEPSLQDQARRQYPHGGEQDFSYLSLDGTCPLPAFGTRFSMESVTTGGHKKSFSDQIAENAKRVMQRRSTYGSVHSRDDRRRKGKAAATGETSSSSSAGPSRPSFQRKTSFE